jgi:L-iditol 2-dehydrogenase
MKAIVKDKTGLKLRSFEKPTLDSKDSVLIKVAISGLCRTDMYVAQGLIKAKESIIPGHEFSGVIEAVSPDVLHLTAGDRVAVFPFYKQNGEQIALGIDVDGAFAEYVKVPASIVYKIPDKLSFKEAAYLEPIAASLAVLEMPILPQQKGLILGDNRISALTKILLDIHGFDGVTVASIEEGMHLEANSYDYIIETLANEQTIALMINLVKHQGTIILKSRPVHSVPFPVTQIVKKELKLFGAYYGDFQKSIDLLMTKKIDIAPLLGETYSFVEAIEILQGTKMVDNHKKSFFEP